MVWKIALYHKHVFVSYTYTAVHLKARPGSPLFLVSDKAPNTSLYITLNNHTPELRHES